jgi:hypothetical protein
MFRAKPGSSLHVPKRFEPLRFPLSYA